MMEKIPAYEGKGKYIFVSYRHTDGAFVQEIIRILYEEKYRVWYDEGIAPGSEWPQNIETHLRNASLVLIFVSKDSLKSINCENEVVDALKQHKKIIQFILDDTNHPLLENEITIRNEEDLHRNLDDELIGDGSGYDAALNNRRRFNIWNVLLALSLLLICSLIFALFGISQGYFDDYLPGRRINETVITEKPEQEKIDVDSSALAQAILAQIGQTEMLEEVTFTNEADRGAFYEAIGFETDSGEILTYYDLTKIDKDTLYLYDASEEVLELLKYLPSLKFIYLDLADISSLEVLNSCPYLEGVYLTYRSFPVALEKLRFTVKYWVR